MHRGRDQEFAEADHGEAEPGQAGPQQQALGTIEEVERDEKQPGRGHDGVAQPDDPARAYGIPHSGVVAVAHLARIADQNPWQRLLAIERWAVSDANGELDWRRAVVKRGRLVLVDDTDSVRTVIHFPEARQ